MIRLLIVAWAMLEGAALLGVTVGLLTGQRSMLVAAIVDDDLPVVLCASGGAQQ